MSGRATLLALCVLAGAPRAGAAITLPRLLGDDMVLQRDVPVTLWGWAEPGETIHLEFHGTGLVTRANHLGQWSIVMPPQPAGGPFEIKLKGENLVILKNVLLGDVWLASGQSN